MIFYFNYIFTFYLFIFRREEGSVVHGMVHKVTQQQLKDIDQFEGEGHIYHRIPVTVTTYDGRKIEVKQV